MGFPSAGRNTFFSKSALSLPPLPWPRRMRSPAGSGTGQENAARSLVSSLDTESECNEVAPVLVIGRTRTFRGYHWRAQRLFRRATRAKRRTVRGFLKPEQNFRADALARLLRANIREIVQSFGIEGGVFLLKPQAALRNRTDAAPFPARNFKDARNGILRRPVPFILHRSRVLILDLGTAFFKLRHEHVNRFQQIDGLKPADDNRDVEFAHQVVVIAHPNHGADVPWRDESLHAIFRRAQQGADRRRDEHVGN